jgi:DNA-binding FrmR family transcriptional regulator
VSSWQILEEEDPRVCRQTGNISIQLRRNAERGGVLAEASDRTVYARTRVAYPLGYKIPHQLLKRTMPLLADPSKKKALCDRLARVEGQLRGVQRLIETDAECEKIAQQLSAARKALDKSFFSMVGCMIEQGDLPSDDIADMLAKFA